MLSNCVLPRLSGCVILRMPVFQSLFRISEAQVPSALAWYLDCTLQDVGGVDQMWVRIPHRKEDVWQFIT